MKLNQMNEEHFKKWLWKKQLLKAFRDDKDGEQETKLRMQRLP